MKPSQSWFVLLIAFPLLVSMAWAQDTAGAISGRVLDESGAAVEGAAVKATHVSTGQVRQAISAEDGIFLIPRLAIGAYEVEADKPDFRKTVEKGIELTVGKTAVVSVVLQVGNASESVTVVAAVSEVETSKPDVGELVDGQKIRSLPLNGRSYDQLILLQPGVALFPYASRDLQYGSGVKFVVSGSRPHSNLFLLDGTEINDQSDFTPGSAAGVMLGIDTLQEFLVLTNAYSAEFGRKTGGVVNAVTKSGSNELHGSAFYFARNSTFDARNFFDLGSAPPDFHRHQFGATAGGPIIHNRTFIFAGYEGLRQSQGQSNIETLPNADAHNGCLPNSSASAGLRCTPVNLKVAPYLNLFPIPNGSDNGDGTAAYYSSPQQVTGEDNGVVRIDHQFSSRQLFFARYTTDRADVRIPTALPAFATNQSTRYHYLTLEEKTVFSPTSLNTLRFGFNRSVSFSVPEQTIGDTPGLAFVPGQQLIGTINIDTIVQTLYGSGLGNPPSLPRNFAYNLFEYGDDLVHTRGKYTFKAGVNFKRNQINVLQSAFDPRGSFNFRTLADFLAGNSYLFRGEALTSDTQRAWRQSLFGTYLQVDARLLPNLTVNLGLRWEGVTIPNEIHGKSSNLVNPTDSAVTFGPLWQHNPGLNDLGPRVGFAWDPFRDGKTSVRAGFGIFYDLPVSYFYSVNGSRTSPFFTYGSINNPPFPNAFNGQFSAGSVNLVTMDSNLKTPTKLSWNFSIQRELGRNTLVTASYVGAGAYHLVRDAQANPNVPTVLPDGTDFYPAVGVKLNPTFSTNRRAITDATSSYHALQAGFRRTLRSNLTVQGSYTFSKSIDTNSGPWGVDILNQESYAEDPFNLNLDRALSGFDTRHAFTLSYVYHLPTIARSGLAGALLNGWETSGLLTVTGGHPFTVVSSGNRTRAYYQTERSRPNLRPGASLNPVLGGPNQYFDPTAFIPQPLGFPGNVGRNTVIGPGLLSADASLLKSYRLKESSQIQIRVEFFNLSNRANFGLPVRTVFDVNGKPIGAAGKIQSTITSSRQIQFGLKYSF